MPVSQKVRPAVTIFGPEIVRPVSVGSVVVVVVGSVVVVVVGSVVVVDVVVVPVVDVVVAVSYTHLRAHETRHDLVCRLLLEKKKKESIQTQSDIFLQN